MKIRNTRFLAQIKSSSSVQIFSVYIYNHLCFICRYINSLTNDITLCTSYRRVFFPIQALVDICVLCTRHVICLCIMYEIQKYLYLSTYIMVNALLKLVLLSQIDYNICTLYLYIYISLYIEVTGRVVEKLRKNNIYKRY